MRSSAKKLVVALMLLTMVSVTRGEVRISDQVTLDGNVRYRYELNDKSFNPDAGAYDYASLRSFLGVNVVPSEGLLVRFKFGEARYLGTTASNSASTALVELHEGYVDFNSSFILPLNIRIGRFENWYGSKRLMGTGGWNVYGPRTYDGIRLRWSQGDTRVDLFHFTTVERSSAVTPSSGESFDEQDRRLMGVAVKTGPFQPLLMVDWDAAFDHGQDNADLIVTPAVNYMGTLSQFKVTVDAAYQFGKKGGNDLSSHLLAGKVKYGIDKSILSGIAAGVDYTSGNGASTPATEDHAFYAPYMSRHLYRGFMDYFKDVNNGLLDANGSLYLKPGKGATVSVDLHHFRYVEPAATASGEYSGLGNEIDTRLVMELMPKLSLDAAYCLFMPTEDYQASSGTTTFLYLALTAKF